MKVLDFFTKRNFKPLEKISFFMGFCLFFVGTIVSIFSDIYGSFGDMVSIILVAAIAYFILSVSGILRKRQTIGAKNYGPFIVVIPLLIVAIAMLI